MTDAISELSHLAATSRNAGLYDCLWQAHAALNFAQRGNVSQSVRFLLQAQRQANRHLGASNDPRAMEALERLRRECATYLTIKVRRRYMVQ